MREIYFRGKRADNGEWVYGGTLIHFNSNTENEACFMPMRGDTSLCVHDENYNINQVLYAMYYNVVPETVGQFTGLTDKYGKPIFEGDMLAFSDRLAYVHWHEYCGCWDCSYIKSIDGKKTSPEQRNPNRWRVAAEIIGNIHDNPELMAGDPK